MPCLLLPVHLEERVEVDSSGGGQSTQVDLCWALMPEIIYLIKIVSVSFRVASMYQVYISYSSLNGDNSVRLGIS